MRSPEKEKEKRGNEALSSIVKMSPLGSFSLSVKSGTGFVWPHLPVFSRGDGKPFIAGTAGHEFRVVVRNLTGSRIEVVCCIDGRDVQTDEVASLTETRGLVIPGWGSYEFKGWRVDNGSSRAFVFSLPEDSITAQASGSTENAGVIALAAWKEKPQPRRAEPRMPRPFNLNAGSSYSAAASGPCGQGMSDATMDSYRPGAAGVDYDLGTGAGELISDSVGTTFFERGSGPDILTLGYASQKSLEAAGIITTPQPGDPDPFPGSKTTGYERYRSPGQ